MRYIVTDFKVIPNKKSLQTNEIQAVFDLCKKSGGTIVFPKGKYYISSIYIHSNTTIELECGAMILGSKEVDDCGT